ncbi:MAG: hypothetical protein JNK49_00495 [Planctomycetes bacterium]|nr:hypothetical protein [Planctomycetota bacterium]
MFDRFLRFARARAALREQRYEDALQLAQDPLIQDDRRAVALRAVVARALRERAAQHLAAGALDLAQRDLERLRRHGVVDAAAEQLAAEVTAAVAAAAAARKDQQVAAHGLRALLDAGDTAAVRAGLPALPPAERERFAAQLAARAAEAAAQLQAAAAALQAGRLDAAAEHFQRARDLDRGAALAASCGPPLAAGLAAAAAETLDRRLEQSDLEGAVAALRAARRQAPEAAASALLPLQQRLAAAIERALQRAPDLPSALAAARAAQVADLPLAARAQELVDALLAHQGAGWPATKADAIAALHRAAVALPAHALAEQLEAALAAERAHEDQIQAARERLQQGQLEQARDLLAQVLAVAPLHAGARAEFDLVDQGLRAQDQQLAAARAAARAGRLREAAALAAVVAGGAHAGQGRLAAEAQQLLTDVRARLEVVGRGIDEVRAALAGRATSGSEGVRHCRLRLEELAKVQVDHPELPALLAAVIAELEALEVCASLEPLWQRQDLPGLAERLAALFAVREQLASPARLEARLADQLDRAERVGAQALAAGTLGTAEWALGILRLGTALGAEFPAAAARLAAAVQSQRTAAAACASAAAAALAVRDLQTATTQLEAAEAKARDLEPVRALRQQLDAADREAAALQRAAVLAKAADFRSAQGALADLPPTSPLLRTRIYDMKKDLARAQGLEGAFLLRVDEGGEHLVLRGETVTIGNVHKRTADLPVLANLAGRHASLRRSMSFHGGMQDRIVAEEGELRVAGQAVSEHRLAPGDRVQLGPALGLTYEQPCRRSLTAALRLSGGFQVGGTDRLLLLKDRGRDGRIVLGPGADVHVRVGSATGEVEVYANPSGQMRVVADSGTLDGVPFRGDHPVAAGQLVVAGGISFVLLPWSSG